MPECQLCKREVDQVFKCNYCGQRFCSDHRLPEKHLCPNMPSREQWRDREREIDKSRGYLSRLRDRFLWKK